MTSPMTAPAAMPSEEEIAALLRGSIKVDASGLAPAVVAHYIDGFDEAARAVLELFAPIRAENASLRETIRSNSVWDFPRDIQNLTVKLEAAEARALAAEAAERERCAGVAEAAADREDARAFEKNDDLHVAECRGAERAARTIAAAIRAQGE